VLASPPLGQRGRAIDKGDDVGLLDSIKGLIKGNKKTIDEGIDKAAQMVQEKTPDQIDGAVKQAADAAKDAVDKIDG
jgi:hypothetical protein